MDDLPAGRDPAPVSRSSSGGNGRTKRALRSNGRMEGSEEGSKGEGGNEPQPPSPQMVMDILFSSPYSAIRIIEVDHRGAGGSARVIRRREEMGK